jgi:Ca-activated chloride channel family protein
MLGFLAVAVVVVVILAVWFGRGSEFGTARRAKRIATVLVMGSLLLLLAGATQFRFLRQAPSAGVVILTLDVSNSMSRADVEPTRMQAAKAAARDFLDGLREDLSVGLVVFASQAQVLVDPTTEREAVSDALVGLPRGAGTVIGDGLDLALATIEERWSAQGKGPATVILLSDGRDTGSAVPVGEAAARAAEMDVPVQTVVVGRDLADGGDGGGADVSLMAEVAETSGGEAFTATTASGLLEVYRTIEDRLAVRFAITDFGAWFVGAAAILAVAGTIALLVALRTESQLGAATPAVRHDVPRSRPPRTRRVRGGRPQR